MVRCSLFQLCFIFLLVLSLPGQILAKLKVTADRTVLSSNESLTLEIESDQNDDRPGLSVLEKDFDIISQNHSQNFSIINGKSSRKNIWTVLLMPKKQGEVVIPPITFGNETSQSIHLVVHKQGNPLTDPSTKKSPNQDVFINISVTPKEKVYVQQQISLVIQIFTRVQLANLSLSSININDVLMEQIGDDRQYQKIINQQTYQVIERRYALFPQKSGRLRIPELRFEAMTVGQKSNNWPFFSNQGKPILRQSDSLQIEILPKPANFSGQNWLPAENIIVNSIKTDLNQIKVGDSLTITDKISAQGVLGSLLPSIKFPPINGLKIYPDKPKITSGNNNGKILGQREEKLAVIPTQPGNYTIPERKINWWNTTTHQLEEEVIPAFKFTVVAAENTIQDSDPAGINPSLNQDNVSVGTALKTESNRTPIIKKGYASLKENPWFWSTLAIAILYFVSVIIFLYWKIRLADNISTAINRPIPKVDTEKQLLQELSSNCKKQLKKPTMNSLIKWANLYFQNNTDKKFSSLNEIIKKIPSTELVEAIKQLDAAIYDPNASDNWQGEQLLKALKEFLKEENKGTTTDKYKLPPLNPV